MEETNSLKKTKNVSELICKIQESLKQIKCFRINQKDTKIIEINKMFQNCFIRHKIIEKNKMFLN